MVALEHLRSVGRVSPKLWEYEEVLDGNTFLVAGHAFGWAILAIRVAITVQGCCSVRAFLACVCFEELNRVVVVRVVVVVAVAVVVVEAIALR